MFLHFIWAYCCLLLNLCEQYNQFVSNNSSEWCKLWIYWGILALRILFICILVLFVLYIFVSDATDGGDGDSSSNNGGGDPDEVTGPDFEPEDDDSNCFISNEENFPWYAVDMGQIYTISRVLLTAGNVECKLEFCEAYLNSFMKIMLLKTWKLLTV